jgi:hypothetical protein
MPEGRNLKFTFYKTHSQYLLENALEVAKVKISGKILKYHLSVNVGSPVSDIFGHPPCLFDGCQTFKTIQDRGKIHRRVQCGRLVVQCDGIVCINFGYLLFRPSCGD